MAGLNPSLTQEESELLAAADPALQPYILRHRQAVLAQRIPYTVISTWRSRELQAILASQPNRTTPAAKPGRSKHEIGMAWDFTGPRTGAEWEVAGQAAEVLGLRWGGRFTPKPDPQHVEMPGDRAQLAQARVVRTLGLAALMGVVLTVVD